MTDKELKRLSRSELLEMLIAQMETNTELKNKLEEAGRVLKSRRVNVAEAGTMAEAALKLTKVFEAADEAVAVYRENIVRMSFETDLIAQQKLDEVQKEADELRAKTEEECSKMRKETDDYCQQKRSETEAYCKDLLVKTAKAAENVKKHGVREGKLFK